jgi:hypothetical protein
MATYSNNTTIKIGSTIAYNSTSWTYTVPSGSCLVLTAIKALPGLSGWAIVNITLPTYGIVQSLAGYDPINEYIYRNGTYELPAGTTITCTPLGAVPGNGSICGYLKTNTP